jgi:hypothetical protein
MKTFVVLVQVALFCFGCEAAAHSNGDFSESGTGGSGGFGGSATVAGSGGETGSTTEPESGPECLRASDCGVSTFCDTLRCVGGACVHKLAPAGTPLPYQVYGDCHRVTCDGNGAEVSQVDDLDIFDDGNECTRDICTEGDGSNSVRGGDDCSLGYCTFDANPQCVECLIDLHCPAGMKCASAHDCTP